MFAPPQTHHKCPLWHRLFRKFKWFKYFCRWCTPIEFKSVKLPIIKAELPSLDLQGMANVMPLDTRLKKE